MSDSFRMTRRADADLVEIREYIAADNPVAAERLLDRIHDKFLMLGRQPLIGEPRDELRADLRSFPVGNYVNLLQCGPQSAEDPPCVTRRSGCVEVVVR